MYNFSISFACYTSHLKNEIIKEPPNEQLSDRLLVPERVCTITVPNTAGAMNLSLLHNIQTSSTVHPVSYPICGGVVPGGKTAGA
jgi:hypothetical protein